MRLFLFLLFSLFPSPVSFSLFPHSFVIWTLVWLEVLTAVTMKMAGRLLGCSAVWTGTSLPTFQRSVLLPSSVYTALQPSRQPSWSEHSLNRRFTFLQCGCKCQVATGAVQVCVQSDKNIKRIFGSGKSVATTWTARVCFFAHVCEFSLPCCIQAACGVQKDIPIGHRLTAGLFWPRVTLSWCWMRGASSPLLRCVATIICRSLCHHVNGVRVNADETTGGQAESAGAAIIDVHMWAAEAVRVLAWDWTWSSQ
jgi:hypothetical protein